jgi:AAA15 family ATPase/GTPase
MLVRLYGSNFRSLKDDFELSMVAADLTCDDDRDRGVIETPIAGMTKPLRLLRSMAIFGPNASGKSTVLTAGRALRWLGTDSSNRSKPNAPIPPYEPFLLNAKSRKAPVVLGCDVVHAGKILRYEVTYRAKQIDTERLVSFGDEGETLLIDRKKSGAVDGALFEISEANRLYVKQMQPNVAVLSKLAQHGPHQGPDSVQPFYKSIRSALQYEDYTPAAAMRRINDPSNERFADDAKYRDWIMRHLMQAADVGICDVRTSRESVEIPEPLREFAKHINSTGEGFKFPEKTIDVSFVHTGKSDQPVDFSDESSGTKKLFNIADDWWRLANEQVTLLADELGASLHPRLLDRLVRAINDTPTKNTRSQLIFTTHETTLLESQDGLPPALRRDQVYFTKKNSEGASELYSLAEFKDEARPVHNIRKRYLSGLYGAIPSIERLSL